MATPSTEGPDPRPRLDLFALPSHTSLLFALIALVVLGAAFSSLLPGSQLCWPPIVLGLTLLPLRDFLRRPDRTIDRWRMSHRDDEVTAAIEKEMADLGLDRPPAVFTTDRPLGLHAFGTFRRRYLGIGHSLAQAFHAGLQAPPGRRRDRFRAVLAHEVGHFLNHDVWLMWLSYGLLKMVVLVLLLNLWIGVNLSIFIIENGPEVLQPAFWTALSEHMFPPGLGVDLTFIYDSFRQQNPQLVERLADPTLTIENWQPFLLYLTSAHWPFAASGLALFLVYWRRLLRVRELYADARAASIMGEADIVLEANTLYTTLMALQPTSSSWKERMRNGIRRLLDRVPLLQRQLALHPMRAERLSCLHDPLQVFGSWRWIAVSAGLAVVLLDLILRGTLTAPYIYEPGPHLPFLIGFLVFALWLLPRICVGQPLRGGLARQGFLIVTLFTVIKLLPYLLDGVALLFALMGDHEMWAGAIDLWIHALSGGFARDLPPLMGHEVSWAQFAEWHLLRPVAYFALLMPPTLLLTLLVDTVLKRRALTWYRLGSRLRRVFWTITALLTAGLTFILIPIYNRLLFPYIYETWTALGLIGAGGTFLALCGAGVVFWRTDRRIARRCPGCDRRVSGPFHLGKQCDACQCQLHPWLIANY